MRTSSTCSLSFKVEPPVPLSIYIGRLQLRLTNETRMITMALVHSKTPAEVEQRADLRPTTFKYPARPESSPQQHSWWQTTNDTSADWAGSSIGSEGERSALHCLAKNWLRASVLYVPLYHLPTALIQIYLLTIWHKTLQTCLLFALN